MTHYWTFHSIKAFEKVTIGLSHLLLEPQSPKKYTEVKIIILDAILAILDHLYLFIQHKRSAQWNQMVVKT